MGAGPPCSDERKAATKCDKFNITFARKAARRQCPQDFVANLRSVEDRNRCRININSLAKENLTSAGLLIAPHAAFATTLPIPALVSREPLSTSHRHLINILRDNAIHLESDISISSSSLYLIVARNTSSPMLFTLPLCRLDGVVVPSEIIN